MGKKSRKPKYYDCPCGRKLRLEEVRVPRHIDHRTDSLCLSSRDFIPEIRNLA